MMKKRLSTMILIAGASIAAASPSGRPRPALGDPLPRFAFQKYPLGLHIMEFRSSWTGDFTVCSNDANAPSWIKEDGAPPGAIKCFLSSTNTGEPVMRAIQISDFISTEPRFGFWKDHLATIELPIERFGVEYVVAALTEKYGMPTHSTEAAENGFGDARTQEVWRWLRGSDVIEIRSPDYTIKRASIRYRDSAAVRDMNNTSFSTPGLKANM